MCPRVLYPGINRDGVYERSSIRMYNKQDILKSWFPWMFNNFQILPYPKIRRTTYSNYVPYDPYRYHNRYHSLRKKRRMLHTKPFKRRPTSIISTFPLAASS